MQQSCAKVACVWREYDHKRKISPMMRAIFVLFYLPVLFSATNLPKLSLQWTDDASTGADTLAGTGRVISCHSGSPVCQQRHCQVTELSCVEMSAPLYNPLFEVGRSVITVPFSIREDKYSFGSSQAVSLLNLPDINWNRLHCHHPLRSIASFVHPIPFISSLLLVVSLVIFLLILSIFILNVVWYFCWHCVKQINPLQSRTVEKKLLHVPIGLSRSKKCMLTCIKQCCMFIKVLHSLMSILTWTLSLSFFLWIDSMLPSSRIVVAVFSYSIRFSSLLITVSGIAVILTNEVLKWTTLDVSTYDIRYNNIMPNSDII